MNNKAPTDEICPNGPNACPRYSELGALNTELKELRAQVIRDHLTGLYNPRHLEHCINQELERTLRSRQPTSLIMLDIDFFKHVNDTYGHAAGDIVLKHTSRLLVDSLRKLDICCRYGGEEFAIILPSTHLLPAIQVAERIRCAIEDTVIHLTEGDINITVSIGVNTFQFNTRLDQQAFIESVDKQLYRAKASGRNQVCYAEVKQDSSINVSLDEREALFGDKPE